MLIIEELFSLSYLKIYKSSFIYNTCELTKRKNSNFFPYKCYKLSFNIRFLLKMHKIILLSKQKEVLSLK